MPLSRFLSMVFAVAMSFHAGTGCSAEPVKIRVSWIAPISNWASLLLEKKELAQHLGKSYALEPVRYAGTPQMVTALANGELEIANLAFSTLPIAIQNANLDDLRVIADEFQDGVPGYYSQEYMVLSEGPIKKIEDLKGKVVAINAGGSAVDIAIRTMLRRHGLDASVPWLAVAAMMRPGDKLASYRVLARMLAGLRDLPWQFLVAGDGPARAEVEAAFAASIPGRVTFLGALSLPEVAAAYAAADLCVWPAVNEAYGMAMLEAQAAGLPVVSCATRGVPDVVEHGRTGLLAASCDERALASLVRELLLDNSKRSRMSAAAVNFAAGERSIDSATARLGSLLERFAAAPA